MRESKGGEEEEGHEGGRPGGRCGTPASGGVGAEARRRLVSNGSGAGARALGIGDGTREGFQASSAVGSVDPTVQIEGSCSPDLGRWGIGRARKLRQGGGG